MAALGGIESLLGSLPADTKKVFTEVFRALVPFLRYGPVENQTKAENFASYVIVSTTATSTGEFSVAHGLGRAPYRIQAGLLAANSSGMGTPTLFTTRPADASRMYFKTVAGDTNVVFAVQIE